MALRKQGVVKFYDDSKKWGFIQSLPDGDDGFTEDYFVLETQLRFRDAPTQWQKRLHTGEYVEFSVGDAHDARPRAQAMDVTGVRGGALQCEAGDFCFKRYRRSTSGGEEA